jgi:hypothetical protein
LGIKRLEIEDWRFFVCPKDGNVPNSPLNSNFLKQENPISQVV